MSTQSRPLVRPATVVVGAVTGTAAYLLGYLLVALAAGGALDGPLRGFGPLADAGARFAPTWKTAGWLFYDAHFVGTRVPGFGPVDLVALAGQQYAYLVPPLALLAAGAAVAAYADVATPWAGVVVGTSVVAGYGLLALLGALVLPSVGVGPSLLRSVVLVGVVYPVAFGAAGGALAGVVRADRATSAAADAN